MAIDGLYKNYIDWDILGYTNTPIVIENYKGLKICIEKNKDQLDLVLYLDSINIMTTSKFEHDLALRVVNECPENSRVLVSGLGFGLVLLYLAESCKSKEVIIVEKDKRVLEILAPRIEKYLKGHDPKFNFKIIEGDIYDEILNNGIFDWIFIDISDGTPDEFHNLSKIVLSEHGVFSSFRTKNQLTNGQ